MSAVYIPGSRHLVEAGARGMETPPRNVVVDLEEVRPGRMVFVCISRNDALSSLVLPQASSSIGAGCHGSDVAEATSLCIPLIALLL